MGFLSKWKEVCVCLCVCMRVCMYVCVCVLNIVSIVASGPYLFLGTLFGGFPCSPFPVRERRASRPSLTEVRQTLWTRHWRQNQRFWFDHYHPLTSWMAWHLCGEKETNNCEKLRLVFKIITKMIIIMKINDERVESILAYDFGTCVWFFDDANIQCQGLCLENASILFLRLEALMLEFLILLPAPNIQKPD